MLLLGVGGVKPLADGTSMHLAATLALSILALRQRQLRNQALLDI